MNTEMAFVLESASGECVVSTKSEVRPELKLWLHGNGACHAITGKEALEGLSEAISHALGRLDFREVWEKAVRCEAEMSRFAQEADALENRLERVQKRLERAKAENAQNLRLLNQSESRVRELEELMLPRKEGV